MTKYLNMLTQGTSALDRSRGFVSSYNQISNKGYTLILSSQSLQFFRHHTVFISTIKHLILHFFLVHPWITLSLIKRKIKRRSIWSRTHLLFGNYSIIESQWIWIRTLSGPGIKPTRNSISFFFILLHSRRTPGTTRVYSPTPPMPSPPLWSFSRVSKTLYKPTHLPPAEHSSELKPVQNTGAVMAPLSSLLLILLIVPHLLLTLPLNPLPPFPSLLFPIPNLVILWQHVTVLLLDCSYWALSEQIPYTCTSSFYLLK